MLAPKQNIMSVRRFFRKALKHALRLLLKINTDQIIEELNEGYDRC
ncbi:hypothetical protein [Candidatus Odyssella acanthamoebae]